MRALRRLLTCILMLTTVALAIPAATFASGGGSAGDQQYTDPFAGTPAPAGTRTATRTATTPAPAPTTAPAPVTSTPAQTTPAAPAAATATTPAPAATTDSSAATTATAARPTALAFTGYDGWLAGALGVSMIAGGVVLRSRARRT